MDWKSLLNVIETTPTGSSERTETIAHLERVRTQNECAPRTIAHLDGMRTLELSIRRQARAPASGHITEDILIPCMSLVLSGSIFFSGYTDRAAIARLKTKQKTFISHHLILMIYSVPMTETRLVTMSIMVAMLERQSIAPHQTMGYDSLSHGAGVV